MICTRCGKESVGYSMSWFNVEEVCLDCKDDEYSAPNYEKARDAEAASLKRGERSFSGIGLSPEDQAYLAQRRAERNAS